MACYMEADEYLCKQPCEKNCPQGHRCPKKCGEICGNCIHKVEKMLPRCSHINTAACYQSPSRLICNFPCEKTLPCGHECQEMCGSARCTSKCKVEVEKKLPCQHIALAFCHLDPKFVVCHQKVEKTLPCGHTATVECLQDLKTFQCRHLVEKKLPCEHVTTIECSLDPTTYVCLQKVNDGVCAYGHTKEIKCCDSRIKVGGRSPPAYIRPTSCGRCRSVCDFTLACGHRCTRVCRECVATKCHGKCDQILNQPFSLCHHKSLCSDSLRPCQNYTAYSCFHRKNTDRMCTEPHEICLGLCDWNCPHYACTAVCSQPCNRPPCNQPCRKPLKCGHICSGICGELCLSECIKCARSVFMGRIGPDITIPSNGTRFLHLQPCGHFVEVATMDVWVQENVQQLPGILDSSCFLRCPKCSEKVSFCPRYNQYIRRHELALNAAKKLIKDSKKLKQTMEEYINLWQKTNRCDSRMKEKLDQQGVNERIILATLCILHETEVMEGQRKKSDSMHKQETDLLNIWLRVSKEDDYFEDRERVAADVITMYKLYMIQQVRRLMTFVRGPNLRVLDASRKYLEKLDCIDVTADNFQNIWTTVEKLNRWMSTKLSPRDRKDEITDYIDHLNRFYDLQLDATFLSHWMCCKFGHVYSTKEKLAKDQIDALCPQCHALHHQLLYFLKPEFGESAITTQIDTSPYYKSTETADDLSYRTELDCSESIPLAEIVADGNFNIPYEEKSPEVEHSNLKAKPESVFLTFGTSKKKAVGESSFPSASSGRKGLGRWTQSRLKREAGQLHQLVNTDQEWPNLGQSGSINTDQEWPNLGQSGSSCDSWRTKDANQSSKATSSYLRDGASVSTTAQQSRSRGFWRDSNYNKDPENWRAPADSANSTRSVSEGDRDSPISWRDRARSQKESE